MEEIKTPPSKTKDYVQEYNKKRYQQNKDTLKLRASVKARCEDCNCEIVKCKLNRHYKTKIHIDKVKNNQQLQNN